MKEGPEKNLTRGKKGIVYTKPSESDPTAEQRLRINKKLADLIPGISVTGHAYFGDPKAYLAEGGEVGGQHGAMGAGNPDTGYMPEMLDLKRKEDPIPTVMSVMAKAAEIAAKENQPAVSGIFCNQLGCQPKEALAPINPNNPDLKKYGQATNYQNIVDTTRGLRPDFAMFTPMNRTTKITEDNPSGTQEQVVMYRSGQEPVVLGVKGKRMPYSELIRQGSQLARSDAEKKLLENLGLSGLSAARKSLQK